MHSAIRLQQSPLPLAGLASLWAQTEGDAEIRVAILDGPVDLAHACFQGARLKNLETLVSGHAGTGPASQHGTHVASIVFGRHGGPVTGLAPGCTGILVPVFSDGPNGSLQTCSQLDLARAIQQSVDAGAHVISISAGQLVPSGTAEEYLAKAIRTCAERNVLLIAAAGNDGCDCLHVPAALPAVLTVGAMDSLGVPLEISNWGEAYRTQGVLAPGEAILGAVSGGTTARKSGTSFATAVVTGIAALLLSLQRKNGRAPDPRQVRAAILTGAIPCGFGDHPVCRRFLAGRLDIAGAVASLQSVTPQQASQHLQSIQGENYVQSEQMEVAQVQPSGSAIDSQDVLSNNSAGTAGPSELSAGEIAPSDCGCGGGKCGAAAPPKPQLVYALGLLTYDFGSEVRRDSLIQEGLSNPNDPAALLAFLAEHPDSATAITWVLTQDSTPIYAVFPIGPFAALGYERLRQILDSQLTAGVEQVAVPGYIGGKTILQNGQVIPILVPELRGLAHWSAPKLIEAVLGAHPGDEENSQASYQAKSAEIGNFLERVYYEIRNLGITSQDRALNYAATNAFQVEKVFERAINSGMKLDSINVERSPICRPGSDCWDVKLSFFNPAKRFEEARHVYRFTVDVSEVIPVTVGRVRHWDVY